MPRIVFTNHLRRHLDCPPQTVEATTVRVALEQAFAANGAVRDYIVDERFRLRKHITLFVDGRTLVDRETLSDPLTPESEIYVMQALSGG
jgi:molybdopterin synthase sulfur carrier subunit